MLICLPYDLEQFYAFYCSRYQNISMKEFLNLGYDEFRIKINSIPENEPIYKIIKARSINLNKIKDKEERKYWREMKEINKIPDIYKTIEDLNKELEQRMKEGKIRNVR